MIGQLGALRKEARDLNLVPTDKAVADAANLGRLVKRQFESISAAIFEVGAAVAPVLFPVGEAILRITGSVTKWVRENGELIRTIFRIASIVATVGTVITGVGAAIFGIGTVAGMVAAGITGIVTAISSIVGVVATIGSLLAPILVPLGLIALAVGGVTTLLLRNQTVWGAVSSTAKSTIGSIFAAVALSGEARRAS